MKVSMDYVNDNTFKVKNESNNELLIDMCDPEKKKSSFSDGIIVVCRDIVCCS